MSLKDRHILENNSLAFWYIIVVQAFSLAATFMYHADRIVLPTAAMLVIEAVAIVEGIVAYVKFRQKSIGKYLLTISMCLSYAAILFGSIHCLYLWAFAPMILITTMLFDDKKLTRDTAIVVIACNFLATFVFFAVSTEVAERKNMVMSDTAFAVVTGVMAIFYVGLSQKHSKESIEEIENAAIAQQNSAKRVEENSAQIALKLEDAHEAMNSLSDKVVSSAEAVEQISASVTLTAEAIQTQTEMNSNITESLENIAHQSRAMNKNSNAVTVEINEGNALIQELRAKSEEASTINAETAEMTSELQNTASTVKEIVDTILGISSQTNLLALNASIEAARAGEAGKGFAVVADEIRNLSENTKESAEEIASTIDDLIEKVNTASANMEKSVQTANEQGVMITETGEKFEVILEKVNELSNRVKKITDNVDSCVEANSKVMDAISNLSATSEEVAASSESSINLSQDCKTDMESTKEVLDSILELSREIKK